MILVLIFRILVHEFGECILRLQILFNIIIFNIPLLFQYLFEIILEGFGIHLRFDCINHLFSFLYWIISCISHLVIDFFALLHFIIVEFIILILLIYCLFIIFGIILHSFKIDYFNSNQIIVIFIIISIKVNLSFAIM
jgi:hypothetical protein